MKVTYKELKNPFQIKTPEALTAEETVNLFVDEYTEFPKIKAEGHTFIIGPRGTGKSMIFRYLQPDCQCQDKSLEEIGCLGLYIPLRNAGFTKITEMKRLYNTAAEYLNEHIMVAFFLQKCFAELSNEALYVWTELLDAECMDYYQNCFLQRLSECDRKNVQIDENAKTHSIFCKISQIMETIYLEAIDYTKRLSFRRDAIPYEGSLYEYLSFVIPLIEGLKKISCFAGKSVYFLIDDAHRLDRLQTRILNNWISTRTSGTVSLKISSQYNYKTYYTTNGEMIETPHDFSEVDMTMVYTGKAKRKYLDRVNEIIKKRLANHGIDVPPEEFFEQNEEQEKKIQEIAEQYKKKYDEGKARGNRREDDALRYARPDYIKSLSGNMKTYSYAGFEQLVHLSSGIIRFFLEAAYKMYAEEESVSKGESILKISHVTQNNVARKDADDFLFNDLPRYAQPKDIEPEQSEVGFEDGAEPPDEFYPLEDIKDLTNLIQGLGGLFHQILLSDRSERRVFSVAISDQPSPKVEKIFRLGMRLGYFHKSTIGRKDGGSGGRTALYILNRRLAPIWTLDVTSFAGYLFVQNSVLEEAMINPASMLRRMYKRSNTDVMDGQISLFESIESTESFYIREGEEG